MIPKPGIANKRRRNMKPTIIFLMATFCASAATITTLHNSGEFLASQAADPYWTVNGHTAYKTQDGGFPFITGGPDAWLPDTPYSAWISPTASYIGGSGADPAGLYIYSTTFDLTGFDPTTARLNFWVASDNLLLDVRINGVSIGTTWPGVLNFSYQAGSITSGFNGNINTLSFYVENFVLPAGNPSGMDEAMEAFASPIGSAPEPGPVLLIGCGLALFGLMRRRG
jgi:hypothetical protein